jgi:hypothetical protein
LKGLKLELECIYQVNMEYLQCQKRRSHQISCIFNKEWRKIIMIPAKCLTWWNWPLLEEYSI